MKTTLQQVGKSFFICLVLLGFSKLGKAQCNASFTDSIVPGTRFVYFNNTSSGTGLSYNWSFGDNTTSSLVNPVKTFTANGSYDVCLFVYNSASCVDSFCKTIQVNSIPCVAKFGVYPYIPGPKTRYFVDSSSGSNLNYTWTFGDTSAAVHTTNASHTWAINGTYLVCLRVVNSLDTACNSMSCKYVGVYDSTACSATFTYLIDSTNQHKLRFNPSFSPGSGISYLWNFGDSSSSSLSNPQHIFGSGTFRVCLNVTKLVGVDTCRKSQCVNIVVGCKADFTAVMSGSNPRLFNFTSLGTGLGIRNSWNFGEDTLYYTTSSKTISHTYAGMGTFLVCLKVTGYPDTNCTDKICKAIFVNDTLACNPYFTFSSDSTNYIFNFLPSLPYSVYTTYHWTFSDSTTSSVYHPSKVFQGSNVHTVCLTTTRIFSGDTCVKIYCRQITPGCSADFTASQLPGDSMKISFNNLSVGKSLSYQWTFGNGSGSTLKNPVKLYDSAGTYTVCLTIRSATDTLCNSSKCKTVKVTKPVHCKSLFYFIHDSTNNLKVQFVNLSTADDTLAYYWNFGDGTPYGNLRFPTHTYANAGRYRVCLYVATPGCSNSYCDSVIVGPGVSACSAEFSFTVDSVSGALGVNNLSTGTHLKSLWSFGDSTFSNLSSPPPHLYAQVGIYNVCLFVADSLDSNCNGIKCHIVPISIASGILSAKPENVFTVYPVPFDNLLMIQFQHGLNTEIQLSLSDLEGRVYLEKKLEAQSGSNQLKLQTELIPPGIYLIQIQVNGQTYHRKLVKM